MTCIILSSVKMITLWVYTRINHRGSNYLQCRGVVRQPSELHQNMESSMKLASQQSQNKHRTYVLTVGKSPKPVEVLGLGKDLLLPLS